MAAIDCLAELAHAKEPLNKSHAAKALLDAESSSFERSHAYDAIQVIKPGDVSGLGERRDHSAGARWYENWCFHEKSQTAMDLTCRLPGGQGLLDRRIQVAGSALRSNSLGNGGNRRRFITS